jgi:hypothetical protein
MQLNQNNGFIMVNLGSGHKPGSLFCLDTPIWTSTTEGKKSADWSNYRLWAAFYMAGYGFPPFLILAAIVFSAASAITNLPLHIMLRPYFGADWIPPALLALAFSIFPFYKTWPAIFSQLMPNPRKVQIGESSIIFTFKDKAETFHKATTRVTYKAEDLFGIIPFKVVTFYLDDNEKRAPFYHVVMKMSLAKNDSYKNQSCDEFVRDVESAFELQVQKPSA